MKTNLYKFILRLTIVLFVIVISDKIVGRVLHHFYFSQKSGDLFHATYIIDSTKADILVLGSSRASHHYVPDYFEKNLNLSFINGGRDGYFVLYNYAVFKAVTKRYSPKVIIFDIHPNELYYRAADYEKLSALLPYFKKHREIKQIVELKSSFENIKLLSETYPYNSQLIKIVTGNTEMFKSRYALKGYLPLIGEMKKPYCTNKNEAKKSIVDTNNINAIKYIASYCNRNNIKLFFVFSPMFDKTYDNELDKIFVNLSKKEKFYYINFLKDEMFKNLPEYFKDNAHLNYKGASIFSDSLSRIIFSKI